MNDFLGAPLLPDITSLTALATRLVINLLFTSIVVRIAYTRLSQHREYLFTFLLVNVVTFSIAFLLSRSTVGLGLALGLFAVFGILRYRTEAIQVRHLTYLFVVIGLALLNALANGVISIAELLIVNGTIVGTVAILESTAFSGREEARRILYDRLDLLDPARSAELMKDIRTRTNLPATRCEIGDVDLMRDSAEITVYYATPARGERTLAGS